MATASAPSAPSSPARILELELALAEAHRSNNQRVIRLATTLLVEACAAFPPELLGAPIGIGPIEGIRRQLEDGHAYELRAIAGAVSLMAHDGDDVTVLAMAPDVLRVFLRDVGAVLAFVEGSRG